MTIPEQNKETIRRLTRSFNARDRETFDSCYAEHVTVHAANGKDRTMDHEAHWREVLGMFEVFPDLEATVEHMVAEGDRVFVRWTYAGTHQGKSGSGIIEPTGRHAAWAAWCEYRLEGGRVVEAWNLSDTWHRFEQLGLLELPKRNEDHEEERSRNVVRVRSGGTDD